MPDKKILDFAGYSRRLDIFATDELPQFSRALVQKMIKEGKITVNGKKVKPSWPLQEGEKVDENGAIASTDRFAPAPSTLVKRLQQQSAVMGWDDEDKVPYVTYTIEDGTRYTVWYEDARSVTEKIRLARMFGIDGLSLWYVGSIPTYEEEGLHYNVWQAVLDQRES